jgi:uncharacterized protein (TIGR03663 family)
MHPLGNRTDALPAGRRTHAMIAPEPRRHWLDRALLSGFSLSREAILWMGIASLAILTRFYDLGNRVMSHDEIVHALTAWQFYKGEGYVYLPLAHGPFQFHLLAFLYLLLGATGEAVSRAPAAFFGVAAVCLIYFFRRYLGRWGALAAALGMTFSPYLLYYDRYARNESFVVVWGLLTFFSVIRYLETKSDRWLYVFTAVSALHFATKETAFIFSALLSLFLATRLMAAWVLRQKDVSFRAACRLPEADLLAAIGITVLPLLAAIPMTLFHLNPWVGGEPLARIFDPPYLMAVCVAFFPLPILAFILGWMWDRRRAVRVAIIFFGIYLVLYSSIFSSPEGWITGIIGSLNYWIAQHGVERGGQPWYYYAALQIPLYEYLPALLTLLAPIPFLREWGRHRTLARRGADDGGDSTQRSGEQEIRFIGLMLFWAAGSLVFFSLAGEKMPWLTVHITLPCILIGGWVTERLLANISFAPLSVQNTWRGWLLVPILPLTTSWAVGKWLGIHTPFAGFDIDSLRYTMEFVGTAVASVAGWCLLAWLWRKVPRAVSFGSIALACIGWLFLLTVHTALTASFANANSPNEFLYYAQFSPGVRFVMRNVENLAQTNPAGSGLPMAYDENAGLTMRWYLREYPNAQGVGQTLPVNITNTTVVFVSPDNWDQAERLLGAGWSRWEGVRIWWPCMDYMNLTPQRVFYAIANSSYREALWNIWYYRDFSLYASVTHEETIPERWPAAERMRMYTRP